LEKGLVSAEKNLPERKEETLPISFFVATNYSNVFTVSRMLH